MDLNYNYLIVLILLFLTVIIIGLWANSKVKRSEDYSVAGRSLGVVLSVGTFVATFLSSVAVIGGVGYASNHGWSFLVFQGIGIQLGIIILVLLASRIHNSNAETVPDYLKRYYGSRYLQSFSAFCIIVALSITLISQLYAVGIIVETIVGLPEFLAVLIVGIVFLIYTVMGGLTAIARTDTIQATIIFIGLSLSMIYVIVQVPFDVFFSEPFDTALQGDTATPTQVFAWMLVWGLGVAAQPQYLQRMFATKDQKTARLMFGYGSLGLLVAYLAIVIIGIGAFHLAPEHLGDGAFPYLASNVFPTVLGIIVMAALLGAILSTVDSILNIVGVYTVNDIVMNLSRKTFSDRGKLVTSRIATLTFGLICIGISVFMTFQEITFIVVFAAYTWGIIGSTLFVPVIMTVLPVRLNLSSGIYSCVFGFIGAIGGWILLELGVTTIDEIYWGVGLSIVGLFFGHFYSKNKNTGQKVQHFS